MQDLPGDLPKPDDSDDSNDGDPPNEPDHAELPREPHNENERFLQVMLDLAAGICTLHQPPSTPQPEKIKVQEPDTFDGSDPCKLRDFLVSCNLRF